MNREPAKLQPYTTKDLCLLYGVTYKTLQRWLNEINGELGKKIGKFWNVYQVEIIFKRCGRPEVGGEGR
jgi:hypothetical protein